MLFQTSLNAKTRLHLPRDFYVEWVLLHNSFPFTICKSEEENCVLAATTTPMTEPTADAEPEPATIPKPMTKETKPKIVP